MSSGHCWVLVALCFLTVFPLESQSQEIGFLELQLQDYKSNFAKAGEACDEDQARMKYSVLISRHGSFDRAQQLDQAGLVNVSKLLCALTDSFEIICQNNNCECVDSRKQYFPNQNPDTCRFKFGETCTSGEDCPNHLICSNEIDLRRLSTIRQGPYQWKFNGDCIRDCIDRLCNREAPNCSLYNQNCLAVTNCFEDPFEVPFQCIGECSNCPIGSDESDFALAELCENNCGIERDSYTDNSINRHCYTRCQRLPAGQECYRQCSIQDFALTARQRREACPAYDGFKRTGCTKCVWDSITDAVDQQIRKDCLVDCPLNDTIKCNTNCSEHCIREQSIEAELGCFFQCGVPTIRNPMCFSNCIFNKDSTGAIQSCKNNCEAPPITTQCERCARTCKRRTQLEFQLGRSELAQVVHCNGLCAIPQLDCTTCETYFQQQGSRCVVTCNSNRDCQTKCMTTCTTNLLRVRQGECYNECFRKIDSFRCLASCFDKFKNNPPNQVCQRECANPPMTTTGDCSSCEDNCKTSMEKLLKSFCLPDKGICRTISKCETCTVDVATRCRGKCRPSGVSETPERCRTQCLDVCEPIRDYLIAKNPAGGAYIPSCEIFCAQSALTKCLARCENFCDKMAPLICNCSSDGDKYSDTDVNEISRLVPDACRNCQRGVRRVEHEKCRRDCIPTATLDPNGVMCFSQCLDYCEKAEWFRHQIKCSQSCKKGESACGGSEQSCLDKTEDHHKIRSRCFERCYHAVYDPTHYVCFPQRCQDQCAEEVAISAPLRCLRPTPTAICDDTAVRPVVTSKPKISECSNCTRNVRIYHLDVCRRTCEIKNTDGQLDINKFCTESCEVTCMTRLYWNQYKICQQSSPTDVAKCVKDAVPDLKEMCAKRECPTTNLPTGLSFGQCPNCIDHCYKHDFFETAARLSCIPCNQQTQTKQSIISCDICKSVRVEPKCEILKPGCPAEKDCIVQHCAETCSKPKTPPAPTCGVECSSPSNAQKNRTVCILDCETARRDDIVKCNKDCQEAPAPNECQNKCSKEECEKELTAQVCGQDCSMNITELVSQSRRRRQVRPQVRPTRRPRPNRQNNLDFYDRHWCCFDNGAGRCNSSNPRQLGITANINSADCLCVQKIMAMAIAMVSITLLAVKLRWY